MATKYNLPSQYYWEANKHTELATKIGRTSTGNISETSSTSGTTYNSTTGEDGILLALTTALVDYNWRAEDANAKLDKSGGTIQSYAESVVNVTSSGGIATINLALGNVFAITLTENTTLSFTNFPASGLSCSFTIFITQPASAKTVVFPSSVKFSNNVVADLSTPSKVSIVSCMTINGGTRVFATAITKLDV